MENKQSTNDNLTGKKRSREETENVQRVIPASKRIKPNHSGLKTPFTSIPNFEPHILNIISSYTTNSYRDFKHTHHHWWFIHGLSNDIVKAIESIILCEDLETFKLFAKLPEFRDNWASHGLHTKAMLWAMDNDVKHIADYINDCKDIHSGYKDDNLMIVAKSMDMWMVIHLNEKYDIDIPTDMYDTLFDEGYWYRECDDCGYGQDDDYHFIYVRLGYPVGLCSNCYTHEFGRSSDDDSCDSDTSDSDT